MRGRLRASREEQVGRDGWCAGVAEWSRGPQHLQAWELELGNEKTEGVRWLAADQVGARAERAPPPTRGRLPPHQSLPVNSHTHQCKKHLPLLNKAEVEDRWWKRPETPPPNYNIQMHQHRQDWEKDRDNSGDRLKGRGRQHPLRMALDPRVGWDRVSGRRSERLCPSSSERSWAPVGTERGTSAPLGRCAHTSRSLWEALGNVRVSSNSW